MKPIPTSPIRTIAVSSCYFACCVVSRVSTDSTHPTFSGRFSTISGNSWSHSWSLDSHAFQLLSEAGGPSSARVPSMSESPHREAMFSLLPAQLREELERAEEQYRRDIAEALAAKGRATELIRTLDKPFEHAEAELETEHE